MLLILVVVAWLVGASPAHADFIIVPTFLALQFAGVPMFVALAVANAVPYLLAAAAIAGLQYALAPKLPGGAPVPKPEDGQIGLRQAISPRVHGYGKNRLAGTYMLYEEKHGVSWDVLAFHSGKIGAIVGRFLHEDAITVDGSGQVQGLADGRYNQGGLLFKTTLGLNAETAFADVAAALPEIWTAHHRGDGLAALMLKAPSAGLDWQLKVYPHGKPEPSAVCNCGYLWEPRDVTQDPDDPATWEDYPAYSALTTYSAGARAIHEGALYYSRQAANLNHQPDINLEWWCRVDTNPVLQAIDYFISQDHGMGLDRAIAIEPVLARLIEEADICDELVEKKDGTFEPRYASNGFFNTDNDHATVLGQILSTCDGWYGEQVDGTIALWVGKYRAPTVTLRDRHITGYAVTKGRPDEQGANELTLSFTSEAHKFKTVPGESLRNETDIALRGRARSQALDLSWVRSHAQARRLQKRAMARVTDPIEGSLTTRLYGLNVDGQRWVKVEYSLYGDLQDAVVEIVPGGSYEVFAQRCTLNFAIVDPDTIDDWDPDTEEGEQPPVPDEIDLEALPVPEDFAVSAQGDGNTGIRLIVTCDDPVRADLDLAIRYRVKDTVPGGAVTPGPWINQRIEDPTTDGTTLTATTAVVQAETVYEVQIAFIAGGGTVGDFTAIEEVDTASAAPTSPTGLAAIDLTGGNSRVTWTNPNSAFHHHARVYRGITAVFGSAADVSGELNSSPSQAMTFNDSPGVGTFYYWVTAESPGDNASAPTGPANVTVT